MARRKDHSREELTHMILDAAAQLVQAGGAPALTARALGAAIGYAPGTVYNVLGSMDDVAMRLNARTLAMLYARVFAASKDSGAGGPTAGNERGRAAVKDTGHGNDLTARLLTLAMEYRAWAHENPDLWLFLFTYRPTGRPTGRPPVRPSGESAGELPDWYAAEVDRLFGVLDAVLAPAVADAQERRVMARTVWASVHGICFLELTGKTASDADEAPQMLAFLMDRLCAGV